jgi:hypothetical protein
VTGTGRNAKRKRGSDGGQTTLTLTGDRREVEAMALELRRLAKEHGLEFRNMRIQPADEKS